MPAPLSGLSSESQPGMSLIRQTAGAVHPNLLSDLVFRPELITTISTTPLIPVEHRINHMSKWKYMQRPAQNRAQESDGGNDF